MGTKTKSDPSWIDRWKARGVAALTAVAVVLGIGALNTQRSAPDPSQTSSSPAILTQDSVSDRPDYLNYDAWAKDTECKAQRLNLGPPGKKPDFQCSSLFAVAAQPRQNTQERPWPAQGIVVPAYPAASPQLSLTVSQVPDQNANNLLLITEQQNLQRALTQMGSGHFSVKISGYNIILDHLKKYDDQAGATLAALGLGSFDQFIEDYKRTLKDAITIEKSKVDYNIASLSPTTSTNTRCALLASTRELITLLEDDIKAHTGDTNRPTRFFQQESDRKRQMIDEYRNTLEQISVGSCPPSLIIERAPTPGNP